MSRRRFVVGLKLSFLLLLVAVFGWPILLGAQAGTSQSPRVSAPVAGVATPPLRSFPKVSTTPGAPTVAEGLGRGTRSSPKTLGQPDPVRQQQTSFGEAPATLSGPVVNVNGQTGGNPPDPVGDVGPNDYVQMVNSAVAVYNKKGTLRAGFPVAISSLWSALPAGSACRTRNDGDPIVLYDQQVDRWMISQFTSPNTAQGPGGTFPMCIAYSQTGDPTGAYFAYQFNLPRSDDYEKFGIWPDGLYMSTYEGGTLGIYVIDRAAMLGGSPATFIDFGTISAGSGVDGRENRILPADWDGANPPPAGAPNPFVISFDSAFDGGNDRLVVYQAHVDWAAPGSSTFTPVATLNTAAFDTNLGCAVWTVASGRDGVARLCIPQPGTTQQLDAIANRLMHRLQYRNFGDHESMVVSQTVDADGNDTAGVRWYELRHTGGNWSIYQQGTYAPIDSVHRWMPSTAMDGNGNMAIAYSVSDGNTTFPGLRYAGRRAFDPLDSLPAGEQNLTGVAATTSNTGSARWGDYSALTVDPVDDCTFWYTGEYNGAFGTRIGSFRFSDCGTDLRITKTVSPSHPNAGEEIVYTITVDNIGSVGASNVVVTDILPSQVAYLANTDTCTGVAVGGTGTLTCPLGNILAGGSVSFQIKVKIDPNLGGATSITNTASVTSDTPDSNPSNDSVSLTHLVNESADVAVTKFCKPDQTQPPAGTTGGCTIFVHNNGPSAARLVNLIDTHVSNGTFSIGVPTTTQGACVVAHPSVTCNLGLIMPGATARVDVPITSNDGVDVNDTARATSATTDPDNSNNEATAGLSFAASADLFIVKTGPASAVAGTDFSYTLSVDNGGPSTAAGVIVTDNLPSGVTFVSAVASVGTFTHVAGTVTWNLGSVAPADPVRTLTITVHVLPQATGQLVNAASVTSTTADPDGSDNLATWTTTINAVAGLTLIKTDSPDPVTAGNPLTYTITVGNGGPSTAVNVVVTDTLPVGTTFISAVGVGVSCAEVQLGIVRCEAGSLDPGQSRTILLTVLVSPSVPDGTLLVNNAVATSPTDPDGAQASASTTVNARADLWMEKTGAASAGNPSGALTYRLIVHNHPGSAPDDTPTSGAGGPSDAQNVVVVDPLPLDNKKLLVQFLTPGCTYNKPAHTVTCSAATVPFGTSVVFEIQVQINGSNGTITNRATVSSSTVDSVPGNNSDTVNNVVQGGTGKGPKPR